MEVITLLFFSVVLLGVLLGPTNGGNHHLAVYSAGMQTSRTLGIAEYQYAEDHNHIYPDHSGGSAQDIARILMDTNAGTYISDPAIFTLPGSHETKYTGPNPASEISNANISWDFSGNSGSGLNPTTSDYMPVVWSTLGSAHVPNLKGTGPVAITLTPDMPYGTAGIAVTYKNNNAKFIRQPDGPLNLCPPEFLGTNTATVLSGGG